MFKAAFFIFRPAYARTLIYMLQSVEYKPAIYLRWFWRTADFSKVAYRKRLVPTRPAKMLLAALWFGLLAEYLIAILLIIDGVTRPNFAEVGYGVALLLISPIVWAHLVILPLVLDNIFITKPLNYLKIRRASGILAAHRGTKIAIAGSYGKTTMKEILLTVLSEGKKVAATPANKNVSISHALFAQKLNGDEEVLIIEYGEGAPGDVARFAKRTHPDLGVITGLAPAHLDRYKTLKRAGSDIFSLADYLNDQNIFVNGESSAVKDFIKKAHHIFTAAGIDQWKVKDVKTSIDGVSFKLNDGKKDLKFKSRLLGRHQIAPLVLAVYLGREFGLSDEQIQDGIAKIEPFEHRMKPYQLAGAWIIDDTYNGNIEGMKAGLALLQALPAKRRIYITPGLVDQGKDEHQIHIELGRAIADAAPDQVVLMKHSVTEAIVEGMKGYAGQLIIEDDPLDFYTNLDKFVAAGDVVLMQNDWPDNYN